MWSAAPPWGSSAPCPGAQKLQAILPGATEQGMFAHSLFCMYSDMWGSLYACIHTNTHTLHAGMHAYIHTYMQTYVVHTYVHTDVRPCVHTHLPAYLQLMHAHMHTYIHTHMHTRVHTQTCMNVYATRCLYSVYLDMRAHVCAYLCIYVRTYACMCLYVCVYNKQFKDPPHIHEAWVEHSRLESKVRVRQQQQ